MMIERLDLHSSSSFEDISARVAQLETFVGAGDEFLADDEAVQELQDSLEYLVAYWASELKTWVNRKHEQKEFSELYEVYRRLIRALALDVGLRIYDETGDGDDVKQGVREYILQSKTQLLVKTYKRRLETSWPERFKEKLANNNGIRSMAQLAIRGVVGGTAALAAAKYIHENTAHYSEIESSFARGGIAGAVGVAAFLGARTLADQLKKSGPRQLSGILGDRFNTSLEDYGRNKSNERDRKSTLTTEDAVFKEYAERDLDQTEKAVSSKFFDFRIKKREDVEPMVDAVLAIFEESALGDYDVCLEEPIWRQWLSQLSSDNLDIGMRYKQG